MNSWRWHLTKSNYLLILKARHLDTCDLQSKVIKGISALASVFFCIPHSGVGGKGGSQPAFCSENSPAALWGGPRGKHRGSCQQPALTCQPVGCVSYLGSGSSSPSGVSRSLWPWLTSVATSRESLGQNHHQTSCFWAPDTQTLGEVMSDYICSQQPSLGAICYTRDKEYTDNPACVRYCAGDSRGWGRSAASVTSQSL